MTHYYELTERDFAPPPPPPQVVVIVNQQRPAESNAGAAFCSFLLPGLGQLVQGRFLASCFFFFGCLLLSPTIIGTILFWIWSVLDAADERWR